MTAVLQSAADRELTPNGVNDMGRQPVALTGRQKIALMLAKAGYGPSEIGRRLGICREAASRLLARAVAAEQSLRKSGIQFLAE